MAAVYIISWIVLCIVVGAVANSLGRGFGSYFALSLFLSPLIGFIVLAIKGRLTEEEKAEIRERKYNGENHLFYCKTCSKTFWGIGLKNCQNCKNKLTETELFITAWAEIPTENRDKVMHDVFIGKYDRQIEDPKEVPHVGESVTTSFSSADEIEKFKGLLDKGIITQEEFDAKKKQLLGL